ncbi:hypothetical protein Poli38472_010740 [Pythium oligandrum]|uniref:PHD-type domain-containing protein n=1 Tax=Pythium oligandrum TaxID=41045 RepID=A0A8K1CGD9_PYTOL|nr:hypothetical protein Poli38472_010740 [Pythium oligandrum]|eukprot:TMW61677.1 hypothetical protein Poli38472_010740 [Pythium oligandrum]
MTTLTPPFACPVCHTTFSEGEALAPHVLSCTAPSSSPPTASASTSTSTSCPMCHMVYSTALAPHEIVFHEEECERVNQRSEPMDMSAVNGESPSTGGKRTRDGQASTTSSSLKLFPSTCAVCEQGGRALLHCAGSCARAFHPSCIEELNQPPSGPTTASTAIFRDKKWHKHWVCGECTRGLHACQLCGFLGHESHDVVACSVNDCGFFFHPTCLQEQQHRVQQPLVCPRHTCTSCHALETDMTTCRSCAQCCLATHLKCQDGASTPSTELVNTHVYTCEKHATDTTPTLDERKKRFMGLKLRVHPGDVVLILDYENGLLPEDTKDVAPGSHNFWGVVQKAEDVVTDEKSGITGWNQLLEVEVFADNSTISVLNRYVLPVGSMHGFKWPEEMVRDAIQWHSQCESQLYQQELLLKGFDIRTNDMKRMNALVGSWRAFYGRVQPPYMTTTQCMTIAGRGYASWKEHYEAPERVYGRTPAPVYLYLNTRGKDKDDDEAAETKRSEVVTTRGRGTDDDVEMDDTGSNRPSPAKSSSFTPSHGGSAASTPGVASRSLSSTESVVMSVLDDLLSQVMIQDEMRTEVDVADAVVAMCGPELSKVTPHRVSLPAYPTDEAMEEDTPSTHKKRTASAVESEVRKQPEVVDISSDEDDDSDDDVVIVPPTPKKPKVMTTSNKPRPVKFELLPTKLRATSSIFGRTPLSVPSPLKRKEKTLAELPPPIMAEIEDQVSKYFESGPSTHEPPMPSLRPAFYRPSPMLYRGPRVGRTVDAISRVLLCQDKRNLKCFVHHVTDNQALPPSCPHGGRASYVAVDLLGVSTFSALESAVQSRVSAAFGPSTHPGERWRSLAAQKSPQMALYYCAYDGSQHELATHKPQDPDWLCFCANVCHLTAVLTV